MRWRVLTASLLLVALLASGLALRIWVENRCDQMHQLLQPLTSQLKSGQVPDRDLLEQALQLWEQSLPVLSSLLNHEPLESVGQSLSRASGYLELDHRAGCMAQLQETLYLLDDIRNYDHTSWKILF